jgi:hypothetical protein
MSDGVTVEQIERDPIMKRMAALARDNGWANACLSHYRAGHFTREEALIACLEHMAEDNKRLFEMARRATELSPVPPIVLKMEKPPQTR